MHQTSIYFVAVLTTTLSLFASQSRAAIDHATDRIDIMDNQVITLATVSGLSGQCIEYLDGEPGGPSGMKTGSGRYFNRVHKTYSLPRSATNLSGMPVSNVTVARINARWDSHYGSEYSRSGSTNHRINCWAHALGYGIWIEDPARIYADDYEAVDGYEDGAVDEHGGHVVKITSLCCDNTDDPSNALSIETSTEKNRQSAVYTREAADCPGGWGKEGTVYKRN